MLSFPPPLDSDQVISQYKDVRQWTVWKIGTLHILTLVLFFAQIVLVACRVDIFFAESRMLSWPLCSQVYHPLVFLAPLGIFLVSHSLPL